MKDTSIGNLPPVIKRVALMIADWPNRQIKEANDVADMLNYCKDYPLDPSFIAQTDKEGRPERFFLVALGVPSGALNDKIKTPVLAFVSLTYEEHLKLSKQIAEAFGEQDKLKEPHRKVILK